MKLSRLFSILSMLGILILTACSLSGRSSLPVATEPVVATITPDVATIPASGAIDPCLVGEWRLVDMSAYMITAMESADIQVEYEFSSGQAFYVFSVDGIFLIQADQRTENYVMKFDSGGTVTDIPISISIDGVGSARYSASDGQVTFTNTSSSGLLFELSVLGESQYIDFWAIDESGAETVFLYECIGTDTLHLTPPINSYEVFPVILQRNQ
ncbi:MAG: hypothetical protein ABWK53_06505 [Anaerolineales bacterium]